LYANTTASYNTSVGFESLATNTTGENNCAFGYRTLKANTTAGSNTAFGYASLYVNTTGSKNTAIGDAALQANTTADNNTAVGYQALIANTTASNNTAVGYHSLLAATTGDGMNVCVGKDAGDSITTGARNVCVGTNANPHAADAAYQYVFGHDIVGKGNQTFFAGGNQGSYNEENVSSWQTTSDERVKKNIVNYNNGLSIINQIQVRNFEYKTEDEIKTDNPELTDVVKSAVVKKSGTQLGAIAQEVEAVLESAVSTKSTGIKSLQTDGLFWHMLNAIKELSAKVAALEAG